MEGDVIKCLVDRYDGSFDVLESMLRNSIKRVVEPFSRDRALMAVESAEGLYSIAIQKLKEAMDNFQYDCSLTQEHNERRFLAMLFRYVRNAMIDEQYALSVKKRKPKGIVYISHLQNDQCDDGCDYEMEPSSKDPSAEQIAYANEIFGKIKSSLSDEEREILSLLREGHSAEGIAGRLGIRTSRVRYIIYEKIQKKAMKYVEAR